MRKLLTAGLATLLMASSGLAEMTESLKSQVHNEKELGIKIVSDDSLAELPGLLENPEIKILAMQVSLEKFDDNIARQLLQWVRKGHTLWFYEAQVGSKFGFEPILMLREQFTNKPENGDLGGRSVPGVATVGMVIGGKHETTQGVGQVTVFLPMASQPGVKVEPDSKQATFGAVKVSGDVVPLLRFKVDSPAVAALRREGRGAIFFKPLLWTEPMSGERFQANLLEYSAGYPVPFSEFYGRKGNQPGPKAEYIQGKPAIPLVDGTEAAPTANTSSNTTVANTTAVETEPLDSLDLADGSKLKCKILVPGFRFETGNSNFAYQLVDMQKIDINPSLGLDKVTLKDGKTKTGLLVLSIMKVEVAGQERELHKRQIRTIHFGNHVEVKPPVKP